jgi:hypothetical protein
MGSVFAWLDGDDAHRTRMLEVVKLFQDQSSVDELGIGSVRDTFSDTFFPGTSVLHTRARYLLFIPWLLRDTARHGWPLERARRELRAGEVKLIRALLAGGESAGVIGNQAQEKLKTMPSAIYWAALLRFGLRRWDVTIDAHLRAASQGRRTVTEVTADDDEVSARDLGVDPSLPAPPDDLLTSTVFELTLDEADYLRGVFARLRGGSLLTWLARHGHGTEAAFIWEHPLLDRFDAELQGAIDHARRFHHSSHGAALLYNLMLARLSNADDLVDLYDERLAHWDDELTTSRTFEGWDRGEFWQLIRTRNPRLSLATENFLNKWFALVEAGDPRGAAAQRLIQNREVLLKGNRSRLVNSAARENWTGGSGIARLDYRWPVASRFLNDVFTGLGAA